MSSRAADTVMERLNRLEAALRRGKVVAGGVGLARALLARSGATQPTIPEEIRARRFVLDVGSGSISVFDRDQKARLILGVGTAGWPGLTVYDKDQKPRVVFGKKADGSTGLSFVGWSGARISAGFVQGRFPVLTLHDEDGKARAMMGVSPDSAPRLDLVDQDGVVIWKAP